jgi:hypothetical protein
VLDHLVYATPDVAATADELAVRLGVRAAPGGRHPGVGTHNALLGLGEGRYLEVIGPDPGQPEPAGPRPFGIDGLGAPRLVTWAARVPDIAAAAERLGAAGFHVGPVGDMSRQAPDGTALAWRLTSTPVPPAGGLVPFLIDWGATRHPSAGAPEGLRLVAFHGRHPDPPAIRRALDAIGEALDVVTGEPPGLWAVVEGPTGRVELG